MKRRAILFLCNFLGPNPGNFIPTLTTFEAHISTDIPQNDYRIIYAFPEECSNFSWYKQMLSEGRIVYLFQHGSISNGFRFLESVVSSENVVLIHTHFEALGKAIYLFKLRHPHIPVIWHKHNDFSLGKHSGLSTLKRYVKDFLVDKLVTTVAVSSHLKTKSGYVVQNCLVLNRIPPHYEHRIENVVKESLNLPADSLIILLFGWHKTVKGVDIACKMMDMLPDFLKNRCKLCIVTQNTAENLAYIKSQCTAYNNIILLDNTDDIFKYHMSADIMLSASRSEAFSYSILEALSVGTPVVTSNIPGVQWCKQYTNAYFFRTDDPEDCARAVTDCIANYDRNQYLQIAKQVQEDFNITKWCEQLIDIYKKTGKVFQ